MKRFHIRIRLKMYPVIWSIIILVSIYLLARYAFLSFFDDIGQAGLKDSVLSLICRRVIESKPSLISYTAEDKEQNSFFENIVDQRFALQDFMKDNSIPAVYAQSNASLFEKSVEGLQEDELPYAAETGSLGRMIGFHDVIGNKLGLEYVMTNGAVIRSMISGKLIWNEEIYQEQLNIGYVEGEISPAAEERVDLDESTEASTLATGQIAQYTMEQLKDVSFLVRNFYFVDGETSVTDSLFDGEKLVSMDMTMKQENDAPQILIYHTHSQEAYADSRPGNEEDTVVGIGSYLAKILEEDYGYNVIHDKTYYDVIGGKHGYNLSYSEAEKGLKKMLEKYPTIEVMIDLHRNSGNAKTVVIDGEETAQIMLFNGLCRDQNGPLTNYDNPYLQDNLAFSLQLQLKSLELYPGLFRKNYLKTYRYNLHFRPKSLLMELGTVNNTVQSARNAMKPFAMILDQVLKGTASENEENEIQ